ncbi:hypothetical protein [Chengkuizengella sediminis]|uniref:hypothetical protein n=1 Tax=Chengkuizengella sediminis TaxID=1885917 RepID=UPI001389C48A|nr:hypothetical protein [Chengkuizengella sediminis]NDI33622.1 hypothetical protein [Chengkuizengella sediminis]
MEIIGQGKVTKSGLRELIVKTTNEELRLLTENPKDYRQMLNIGDVIEVSKKHGMYKAIQRCGDLYIYALDKHRDAIIDTGLVDVKKGDVE